MEGDRQVEGMGRERNVGKNGQGQGLRAKPEKKGKGPAGNRSQKGKKKWQEKKKRTVRNVKNFIRGKTGMENILYKKKEKGKWASRSRRKK